MYQKKEIKILQKISPHLSQLNVAMAHRNYFRRNNLQILKLASFKIGKDCQMFIFYFVYTKNQVVLICNENKEIYVANLMI